MHIASQGTRSAAQPEAVPTCRSKRSAQSIFGAMHVQGRESLHVIVEHEHRNAMHPLDALRSHCQGSLHGIGVILRPSRHDDFRVAPTSVARVAATKIPIIQVADAPIGIWIADGDVKATGTRRRLAARTQRAVASRSGTRRRLAAFGTRRAAASSGIRRLAASGTRQAAASSGIR